MRVAVVLGAAVRPDGTASPTLGLRVDHAVALLAAGRVDRICLTGGRGRHGRAEAEVARDHPRARGAPDAALLIEPASASTVANLANAFALLPPEAIVVLVSNRWHLPRAWLAARLMGWRVAVSGPRGAMPLQKAIRAALREVAAMPGSALAARRARARNEKDRPGGRSGPRL